MSFTSTEENFICYYDANVVGDACPYTTVYLVLDDSFIPKVTEYVSNTIWTDRNGNCGMDNSSLTLTREQVFNVRSEFLSYFDDLDNITNTSNDWAKNYLDNDKKNITLYNLRLESETHFPIYNNKNI